MNRSQPVKFLSLAFQQNAISSEVSRAFATAFGKSSYILSDEVATFESAYAGYSDTKYCIGVGNGFDALFISLKSLSLGPADEVIVPANTHHATWLAIANVGAKIVPVEPDENTFNLDPAKVKNALTGRTKVILPVHLYGQPCDMTALSKIAAENDLRIVEDNAQAHGARWREKKTGSWGLINATSFYPTKNLGALGDGGAVTTSDQELADYAKRFRNYGTSSKNLVDIRGVNSRLDELQASFLKIKLKYLDDWNNQRRVLAGWYNDRLKDVSGISTPVVKTDAFHVYHLYVVRAEKRDALKSYLMERGIETMVHYPVPPHLQKAYADVGFRKGSFPVAEALADSVLSLPLWPGMTEQDIDYVAATIVDFYR